MEWIHVVEETNVIFIIQQQLLQQQQLQLQLPQQQEQQPVELQLPVRMNINVKLQVYKILIFYELIF